MRAKPLTLLGIAASGALALLAGSQTWIAFELSGSGAVEQVSGHDANAALSPVAIAIVASALALTIAGSVFRRVLGAVVALLGAGLAWLSLGVLTEPGAAIAGRVTELTGLTGGSDAPGLADLQVTVWAYVCVVAAVVAAALGVVVLFASGGWGTGGRRYAAAARPAKGLPNDRISDWDSLSSGADPSESDDDDDGPTPETGRDEQAEDIR